MTDTPTAAAHPSFMSSIDHAAAWLIGRIATLEVSLSHLNETSPLVSDAIAIGETYATLHGVPVAAVANAGAAVLSSARDFATALSSIPASNAPKA